MKFQIYSSSGYHKKRRVIHSQAYFLYSMLERQVRTNQERIDQYKVTRNGRSAHKKSTLCLIYEAQIVQNNSYFLSILKKVMKNKRNSTVGCLSDVEPNSESTRIDQIVY